MEFGRAFAFMREGLVGEKGVRLKIPLNVLRTSRAAADVLGTPLSESSSRGRIPRVLFPSGWRGDDQERNSETDAKHQMESMTCVLDLWGCLAGNAGGV